MLLFISSSSESVIQTPSTIIRFEEPRRLVQVKSKIPFTFHSIQYKHMDQLMMNNEEFEAYQDFVEFVSGFDI